MNMRNISVLRFKSSIFQDSEYISVCHNIINIITAPYVLMDLKLGRQWWALPWSETSYSQSRILYSPWVKSYCYSQWTDHWWLCSPFCKYFQHTNKELNMIQVNLIWYSLPFLRTAFAGNAIQWSRRMTVQGLFLWTSTYWSRGPCRDLNNNSTYHSVSSLGYFTTYFSHEG